MKNKTCPICASSTHPIFSVGDENRKISKEIFTYFKCGTCGFIFLEEIPKDLHRYYEGEYYSFPPLERLQVIAGKDRAKLPTVKQFKDGGKLLEIGPAFGVFACGAKGAGFDVECIEMDKACCDYLREVVGVKAHQSSEPHQAIKALNDQYDVIASWQVIEHLPDPMAFIESAAEKLKVGGILAISTPNPDSFQFKLMKKRWPHVDAPRHVSLIPAQVIEEKARGLGLATVLFDTDDADSRSWNRFGWQRLFMNRLSGRLGMGVGYAAGALVATLLSPWDRHEGSAYTLVMQKRDVR